MGSGRGLRAASAAGCLSAVPHVPTQCRDCRLMPTSVETMKLIPCYSPVATREGPFQEESAPYTQIKDAECTYMHAYDDPALT